MLKDMLRVEASSPVKSFTFVVDKKVKEEPVPNLGKFKYSDLLVSQCGESQSDLLDNEDGESPSDLLDNEGGESPSDLLGNEDGAFPSHRRKVTEPVVARSSIELDSPSIVSVGGHSFLESAILAYNQHLHLVIRPDDVWLSLITQFSFYVSANAETLRSKFVSFEGKKELVVSAGGTLHTAPYERLALMMTEQIAANIKDPSVREWVLPDFSTTSNTDRVVGAFALMATLKKYFDYKFCLCCGLPKVTILGSVDDWKKIRQRVQRLVEFDTEHKYMEKWVSMLLPVIDHFIRSAEGKPNTKWWNQIANYVGGGSGPTWISGWITVFMVFTSDGTWVGDKKKISTWQGESFKTEWTLIETDDIPKGYASCPLKIDDNGKEYNTEIYAGHIVSKLINNNTTIVPQLDWCILVNDQ